MLNDCESKIWSKKQLMEWNHLQHSRKRVNSETLQKRLECSRKWRLSLRTTTFSGFAGRQTEEAKALLIFAPDWTGANLLRMQDRRERNNALQLLHSCRQTKATSFCYFEAASPSVSTAENASDGRSIEMIFSFKSVHIDRKQKRDEQQRDAVSG